eukprot:1043135-Pyramimonas_sp.AAC.1
MQRWAGAENMHDLPERSQHTVVVAARCIWLLHLCCRVRHFEVPLAHEELPPGNPEDPQASRGEF